MKINELADHRVGKVPIPDSVVAQPLVQFSEVAQELPIHPLVRGDSTLHLSPDKTGIDRLSAKWIQLDRDVVEVVDKLQRALHRVTADVPVIAKTRIQANPASADDQK